MKIVSPKTITASPGSYIYQITFGAVDFSAATSFARLEGPFSLALDITNTFLTPILIGIELQLSDQVMAIADRLQIGFVAGGTRSVISSASVPQIGRINGVITSIRVNIYAFDVPVSGGQTVSIGLRIDAPQDVPPMPETIGGATAVRDPAMNAAFGTSSVFVAAGAVNTVICDSGQIPAPFRFWIKNISIGCGATPSFPSDTSVYVEIVSLYGTNPILRVQSRQTETTEQNLSVNWILNTGDKIRAFASNTNAGIAYDVWALVSGEYIY